jgi:acyl-coenzyme A synthetase/AMP-(fatty) acid ligase
VQGFRVQVHPDPADPSGNWRDVGGNTLAQDRTISNVSDTQFRGGQAQSGQRGLVCLTAPLPPGCLVRLWNDDAVDSGLRATYWRSHQNTWMYQTADWGCADATQRIALLGRADDTINIAGRRIGTREIEETLRGDPWVVDVAVLGFTDKLRGQVPFAFVVLDRTCVAPGFDEQAWCAALARRAVAGLGRAARPRRVVLVASLPRTRSGKVVRRIIHDLLAQAIESDGADFPSAQILSAALEQLPAQSLEQSPEKISSRIAAQLSANEPANVSA